MNSTLLQQLIDAAKAPTTSATVQSLLLQAAEALREAQTEITAGHAHYRALFDAVPDPVSIIALDGTILALNKAGESAYRRPREEIVGQTVLALNPDIPLHYMTAALEAIARGETHVTEATNMRADGARFPVEVHSAGILYHGQPAVVAVARDLTARHAAESRFTNLIEGLDQAVTLQNRAGQLLYMNAAADTVFGITGEDPLVTQPDWNDWVIVDENGRTMPPSRYPTALALQTGKSINSQVIGLFRRSTQHLVWLSVTAVPQFTPGAHEPNLVLALSSNITHLKRDNALFDRVQELASIGAWQWERSTDALYLTREATHILGAKVAPDSMAGVLSCLNDASRRLLRRTLKAIDGDTGFDLELQGKDALGTPFWIRMIGEPDPHDPGHGRLSGTLQDITERKQSEEALRLQAQTDALTGLLNRDAILEHINTTIALPDHAGLSLLYIDLDRFKLVNDMLGHGAGDTVLMEAAQRIRTAVGDEGLAARVGGDEFLVACANDEDIERPERLARQIQQAFDAPFCLDTEEFSVTASIGIAHAGPDGETPKQLIQSADSAMYDSKRRARNGVQSSTPELSIRQQARLQTENQLRRALDKGEFHLVYQPQVDLRSSRILYAEALVRWRNQKLGEMRPDHFIDLAESTGDIIRIGQWVLQEACSQLRRWREQDLPVQRMAVNVSYRQILSEGFVDTVRTVLEQTELPAHALELELTERVLVEDKSDTLNVFNQLRKLGVRLSIDDFGEGYNALNYLRRLPIHSLKLSQGFLKGVPGKHSDVAICQAIIGIARSLGLGVIAEGVETEAQRDFLLRLGVTVGQGFLFAPGLLPGEFARRLTKQVY